MSLKFRKGSYKVGEVRNYGSYGEYIKTEKGWKRLKKGYPEFRRTILFNEIREFLLNKGMDEDFIESNNAQALKKHMTEEGIMREFKRWNNDGGNHGKI